MKVESLRLQNLMGSFTLWCQRPPEIVKELFFYTMGNKISIFENEQFGQIRTSVTEVGKPLFAAADVARTLGYANPQKAVRDHCKGCTKRSGVSLTTNQYGITSEQTVELTYIPEADVYRLVMRSKLPQAEAFQDWVCEEVIPSLRKTGGYMVARADETPEQIMARALIVAQDTIKRAEAEKVRLEERVSQQDNALYLKDKFIEEQAPKALFADAVATSSRSILVAELAKILQQNGVDIGQNRLFEWMRQNGYLCSKGEYYNTPTQKAMEMGLFEIKKTTITKPDGSVLVSTTTKVSGRGQIYFVNKFINKK